MLANFLIGLREGLEAGLIVSILVAYLVKSDRRRLLPQLWSGVAAAIVLSLGFGAALTFGPRGLSHEAQELIGGLLSVLAVVFVTWMIFWMAAAARGMGGELRGRIDRAADAGGWSLVVVGLLAVGREGLETALFLWAATGAATSGGASSVRPLIAAALGLATAVVLAYLLYRGALRLNLSRFFTWTGGFLVLVAGGVLSYGVHDLQEAGVLPGEDSLLFDVSNVLDPSSWFAVVLKGVFNISPVTSVLAGVAWLLYVVPTMTIFLVKARGRSSRSPARPRVPERTG
ncbi:iron uptake transporter permease EfeU [Nocardioides mesophilus]|uniref:FTR1 family protein n=1 Tax=Nocardioides mesophilus TaxID=433659 RepID=A0A7G9R8Y6_9ACTN|nr:iron uptake transporter permease EfeU [Nocardioides mesophilus]QNN52061.1 FTR1 family protein [Nocardioides mesophilus]